MNLTDAQIRGRIKNLAKENNADPRVLMRLYMMERFLERVSASQYRDNFIIKGGVLVTSMLGVSLRSTMDIDTTIQNCDLYRFFGHASLRFAWCKSSIIACIEERTSYGFIQSVHSRIQKRNC